MKFNPEDGQDSGPRCRNCHRGSSGCGACHNTSPTGVNTDSANAADLAADNNRSDIGQFFYLAMTPGADSHDATSLASKAFTAYNLTKTTTGETNTISYNMSDGTKKTQIVKNSRMVNWTSNWRDSGSQLNSSCSDDGLSWPHRTLGWKMLKDDLFGIDITGRTDGKSTTIGPGLTRLLVSGVRNTLPGGNVSGQIPGSVTHDIDSVCLDCHNPTVWNAGQVQTDAGHVDQPGTTADNKADEVILRGLP